MNNIFSLTNFEILNNLELSKIIIDSKLYWGHTKNNNQFELLIDHQTLVNKYLTQIINKNKINIFLIFDEIENTFKFTKKESELLVEIWFSTILLHDIGKINENFQGSEVKMNNPAFLNKIDKDSPINSGHSLLSSYIYFCYFYTIINKITIKENKYNLIRFLLLLTYNIFKHHSNHLDNYTLNKIYFNDNNKLIEFLKKYFNKLQLDEVVPENNKTTNPLNIEKLINFKPHNINFEKKLTFEIFLFSRLNYSLLTASDYLATNEYMNDCEITNFGLLNEQRKQVLHNNIKNKPHNSSIYLNANNDYSFKEPLETSFENLNILRMEMGIEVLQNIQNNYKNNLFYLEAPTGGGKTNLSLIATLELLNLNQKLNKIFYVFPYTTLITQTYSVIKDTLKLNENEIVQLHHKANFTKNKEEVQDGLYGNDIINYIDNLFCLYPFCVLSHIHFFNILKSNKKEDIYLMHRLANAVVVIDEIQAYPPEHWDKMVYFITNYAKYLNIKFIIMSATLPKIDQLLLNKSDDFISLIPQPEKYFTNPNFKNRVTFNFDMLDYKNLDLDKIKLKLMEESKKYAEFDLEKNKPKGSVFTLIEFIYKKTTTKFYELIKNENYFDEIFVISGTILEHRRKQIINYLKEPENRTKKILVITTQVIEAGVDIDMDIGFKDTSLIDSDEQLAGRINRNMKKENATLFLFNLDNESTIYKNDERLKINKDINLLEKRKVLISKNFNKYYMCVLNHIKNINESILIKNLNDYINYVNTLKYKKINDEFVLINENNTMSIFIPHSDIHILDESLQDEISFINENDLTENEYLSGSKIFNLYINNIYNNKINFLNREINFKKLSFLMSKFVINVFYNQGTCNDFKIYSNIEKNNFGFIYLEHWKKCYSLESGIIENSFENGEINFL